jgi:hypothetical protein
MPTTPTPEQATLSLPELAHALGKPNPRMLSAFLAGTSDEQLVKVGVTILSARIVTDTSRLYGVAYDFWKHAKPEQKATLRGFSEALLGLAVHQALELQGLVARHDGKTEAAQAARSVSDAAAGAAFTSGLKLRDQAFSALGNVSSHDATLNAELDTAKGTAEDGDALAAGLAALGKVLDGWIKKAKKDDGLAGRLALGNLDGDYAKALADAAADVKKTAGDAKKRHSGGKVTQGALDRADGINMMLLGQIIDAFEQANDIDPTIPRLVPISTRRHFSRKAKKKGPEEGVGNGGGAVDGGAGGGG